MLLLHHLPPGVDLFMDVDLYRTDVRATAIQGRRKRKLTVAPDIESRHHDDSDRAHIGRTVAEPATPAVYGTGVHAGGTADALQRRPELLHAQAGRAAVVNQDYVHFTVLARGSKVR